MGLLAKGEYMWLGKTPGIYQIADQRVFILFFDLWINQCCSCEYISEKASEGCLMVGIFSNLGESMSQVKPNPSPFRKKKSQLRFSVLPVLVFHGYYSKVSQTGWLKTMEVYSPIVLEARNLKSTCQQDQFLLRSPKENLFYGFFTASGTASNSLSSLACRPITPTSTFIVTWPFPLCVSVSPSVSCKKTHQWMEGPP